MPNSKLPLGKLPPNLLLDIVSGFSANDPQVIQGPGIGLDCAILDLGDRYLVAKSEPITFATDEMGWYALQVAANDIATTGAVPRWALFTVLLPDESTDVESVGKIFRQLQTTAEKFSISVIGGHTEVTHDLPRPIINTTLLAEIDKSKIILPNMAKQGDKVIMTKGIPIEGTALLAREFPERLAKHLTADEISRAQNMLFDPGIGVLQDAQIAVTSGSVTAMHDPTEGGIATALWELASATRHSIEVDVESIIIQNLSHKICSIFGIDPLGTISSGSLLICVNPSSADKVINALHEHSIKAAVIGELMDEGDQVLTRVSSQELVPLRQFPRDEIARVYESIPA